MRFGRKLLPLATSILLLIGCSTFIPKKVELFQDKVKAVPTATVAEKETQRQAAALAAVKADQTLRAAIEEGSSEAVVKPAEDTSLLTQSVSSSLGPPVNQWHAEADILAAKLDSAIARLDRRMDKFADKQDENVGKKIEGTGLVQVPYIVWVVGVAIFITIVFAVLKVILSVAALSNPGVAVGTRVASMGASAAARGFSQLVQAGEGFKSEIAKVLSSDIADKVKEIFTKHHKAAQDGDVQSAIRELTSK